MRTQEEPSSMRLAAVDDRAAVVVGDLAHDVAAASGGAFGPSLPAIFDAWEDFTGWHASAELSGGVPLDRAALGAPSPHPRQVFGIGLNYREHAREADLPLPDVPLVFTKFASCITGPSGTISLPTESVDWEVELAVVIGRRAHRVGLDAAWNHVAGLTGAQDLSARDVQMRPAATPQFSLGKSFPGFGPLGPVLVTPDEFADRDDVAVSCSVNDEVVQDSSTADMVFTVSELIVYLSAILPLLPGDVILTGTPAGVGMGRKPQRYLVPGDVLVTEVAGIGRLRHVFAAA
jgi:2,4-didehydro-3-deoxy-L-rhamnonate hydrolase